MGILRNLLGFGSSRCTQRPRLANFRSRRPALELLPLEDRALLSFQAVGVHASPTVLPANDKYVPVTVTGTFQEYHVVIKGTKVSLVDSVEPGPKRASFQVVDQYRHDQPAGKITLDLTDPVKGVYTFSFTINLQASRRNADMTGRHYNIIVGAGDRDGWNGVVETVVVPH